MSSRSRRENLTGEREGQRVRRELAAAGSGGVPGGAPAAGARRPAEPQSSGGSMSADTPEGGLAAFALVYLTFFLDNVLLTVLGESPVASPHSSPCRVAGWPGGRERRLPAPDRPP